MLEASAETLEAYFADLVEAGAAGSAMGRLRAIGLAAERAMLTRTGGVNTHRGAIFGLGLLCAAVGFQQRLPDLWNPGDDRRGALGWRYSEWSDHAAQSWL